MKVVKSLDLFKNKKIAPFKVLNKFKSKNKKKSKDRKLIVKIFRYSLMVFAIIVLIGVIGVTILIIKYSYELPPPGTPFTRTYSETTQILSRGGTLLYSFHGAQNREPVNLSSVSQNMQWALIASEDKNFYNEPLGISFRGILRAFYHDFIIHSPGLQGGSTITQQLVKDTVLGSQRTFQRKLKELILTIEISQSYSKSQVLQAYLNEVYFGGNVYGIKVASQTYFGVNPSQLNLAQSAMLAGIIQAPSFYSPLFGSNPKYAVSRADYVLGQMYQDNYETHITKSQYLAAKKELLHLQYNTASLTQNIKDPWFVYYVKNQLEQKYGVSAVQDSGWKVYTTLSWKIQQLAQTTVTNAVSHLINAGLNAHNGALVSVDANNGEILAMVGAYKYGVSLYNGQMNGDFNAATAPRQPGSSIKPYLYSTAFQDLGFAPSTFMPDLYININGYSPTDWNNVYNGPMNIKTALRESRNVPAVKTLYALGVSKFITELHMFGFTGISSYKNDLSIAIGAAGVPLLQNTEGYGVLANGGIKYPTVSILKIVSPSGKVVYQYNPNTAGKRIMKARYIYLVSEIIAKFPTLYYAPSPIYHGFANEMAAKTGTSNAGRDLVLMGYTSSIATGMWAGNDNNAPTTYYSFGEDLAPYWNKYMMEVGNMFPHKPFEPTPGITTAMVCQSSGLLALQSTPCTKVLAHFAQGQLPKVDNTHITEKMCKQNPNLLATQSEIGAGDYVNKVYVQLQEYSPLFQGALNTWEKSQGGRYVLPTAYCTQYPTSNGTIGINITSPTSNSTYTEGSSKQINVQGSAISPNNITSVTINLLNSSGGIVNTSTIQNNPNFNVNFNVPNTAGTYTIQVTSSDSAGATGSSSVTISVLSSTSTTPPPSSSTSTTPPSSNSTNGMNLLNTSKSSLMKYSKN